LGFLNQGKWAFEPRELDVGLLNQHAQTPTRCMLCPTWPTVSAVARRRARLLLASCPLVRTRSCVDDCDSGSMTMNTGDVTVPLTGIYIGSATARREAEHSPTSRRSRRGCACCCQSVGLREDGQRWRSGDGSGNGAALTRIAVTAASAAAAVTAAQGAFGALVVGGRRASPLESKHTIRAPARQPLVTCFDRNAAAAPKTQTGKRQG
jgi:hypothetical protein